MEKIVILTGAGISAESGLSTFRDAGGIWAQHAVEDVATPEAFSRNPDLVHGFYNARRTKAAGVAPNPAHLALAHLQREHAGDVVLVTQNVDALHEAAGSRNAIHMHGALSGALCAACGHRWPAPDEMHTDDPCPACAAPSTRPDIVWFGETPYDMEAIWQHLEEASVFAAIGTSGNVYPAAAFGQHAGRTGAHTVELNLEPSVNVRDFAELRHGRASDTVPIWVNEVLNAQT